MRTLQTVLATLSDDEALAVWRALSQWVDNERSRDDVEDEQKSSDMQCLQDVCNQMDAVMALLAEQPLEVRVERVTTSRFPYYRAYAHAPMKHPRALGPATKVHELAQVYAMREALMLKMDAVDVTDGAPYKILDPNKVDCPGCGWPVAAGTRTEKCKRRAACLCGMLDDLLDPVEPTEVSK